MDSERKEFEAKYPMPVNAIWVRGRYAATEYYAWDAQAHQARWEGWQARAEQSRAECEALRKYKAAAMLMVEDARRYHKWRSEFCKNEPTEMLVSLAEFMTPEQVDAVIDAAISKEQQ